MTTKGRNIYFIRPVGMLGPIKIGCSTCVDERLDALATWSPFKLEVIYTEQGNYTLEKQIHEVFADYHSHREWFHPGERLLTAIGKLLAGENIATAINLEDYRGTIRNVTRKPRRPIPEFQKELKSYEFQLVWACKRAEKSTGRSLRKPDDVLAILSRWKGSYQRRCDDAVRPTESEFARLSEVIRNPENHFIPLGSQKVAA
ncbi:hypothetical protein J2855_001777 [Agrobacterium tumefaciens]|uniref:GIY-YIG nuclease family protein n=1 Tax=Agrobacterium tumefaciens TaxID=358 RepID=UPI000DD4DA1C|nr:GIY-YIG nuclease family protein [Agrobacterium tumefaciens]MBP2508142.1 hypothetical protein [Agrobacterium tumefaciens]MBP2517294.1 hypothetical protein [Agrobacterium tumefaciens]MBP2575928.1 hypothetical protein [Agrobacterium tumefaciens]MBP2594284.1 hypothetical protein [Agrobacterium tumefaciens]